MDFSNVKIHCSAIGCLFVEPKDKEAKLRGDLSETAKKHLIKIYCEEYWGRRKEITSKYLEKGKQVEHESIQLISFLDDTIYEKNEEKKENDYVIGTADVVTETEIQDVKSSFEADSFLPYVVEPLEKNYVYQIQGYMWLWGKKKGRIRRCLINTPESIINDEKRKLLYRMDVISEESPEFKIAAAEIEYNNIFDDIDPSERHISHEIDFDEDFPEKVKQKVEKAREFLQYFHQKHTKNDF
jgi:hypothetical protein